MKIFSSQVSECISPVKSGSFIHGRPPQMTICGKCMVLTTDCRRVLSDNKYKMSTRIVYLRAFVLPGGILFIILYTIISSLSFHPGSFGRSRGNGFFSAKSKKAKDKFCLRLMIFQIFVLLRFGIKCHFHSPMRSSPWVACAYIHRGRGFLP